MEDRGDVAGGVTSESSTGTANGMTSGSTSESASGMIGQSIRLGWAESERRLYPLATTSPARYEQAIRLVRAVADGLRATDSVDALLVQWTDATSIVATAASEHGLAIGDLPVEHIAGAAFALRAGELSAAEQQRRQREAIEEARTAGLSWVTLQERGDLGAGLIDPFHSIEMHVPTGLAIVTTVEMDPSTGGPNHVLAVAALDPATGGLIDADPGVADWTEHRESSELAAARQALVELIEVRAANDG